MLLYAVYAPVASHQPRGFVMEACVNEVAKLKFTTLVRGSGLASTAYGLTVAQQHSIKLIEQWCIEAWWRADDRNLLTNMAVGMFSENAPNSVTLTPAQRKLYARMPAADQAWLTGRCASTWGYTAITNQINQLKPLAKNGGRRGVLIVGEEVRPQELQATYDAIVEAEANAPATAPRVMTAPAWLPEEAVLRKMKEMGGSFALMASAPFAGHSHHFTAGPSAPSTDSWCLFHGRKAGVVCIMLGPIHQQLCSAVFSHFNKG